VEGGSANDYDYVSGDPVNSFDLAGTCKKHKGVGGAIRGAACHTGNVARGVGRGAARVGRVAGKASLWVLNCNATACAAMPLKIIAVDGGLLVMAGLGVAVGVASCVAVLPCIVGGTLGFGGAGAALYGMYRFNRSIFSRKNRHLFVPRPDVG
jgi:hypothetical protein